MLARIRKSMEEKDQGFTLIELLVVMIIIGILAAIAIPVFLNQRKKAVDSSMKSDLRTVANAEETWFVDNQAYAAVAAASGTINVGGAANQVTLSQGNEAVVTVSGGTFCIEVSRTTGSSEGSRTKWVYKSDAGGIQTAAAATC